MAANATIMTNVTPKGPIKSVKLSGKSCTIRFSVSDTGIGIPDEKLLLSSDEYVKNLTRGIEDLDYQMIYN